MIFNGGSDKSLFDLENIEGVKVAEEKCRILRKNNFVGVCNHYCGKLGRVGGDCGCGGLFVWRVNE